MANWTFDALVMEPATSAGNEGAEILYEMLARKIGDGTWSENGNYTGDLLRELGYKNTREIRMSTYINEVTRDGDKVHLMAKSNSQPNIMAYELISRCLGLKYVINSTQHLLGQFINTDQTGEYFSSHYNLSYHGEQNYEHLTEYKDLYFGTQFSTLSEVVHFLRVQAEFPVPEKIQDNVDALTDYLSPAQWNLVMFYNSCSLTSEEEAYICQLVTSLRQQK